MSETVLEITEIMWGKVSNEKKKIRLTYKYLHAVFSSVVAHDWLVISATWAECSALCHSIWLPAGAKMSCLCDTPDFWRPALRIVPDCLFPWGSAVVGEGDGRLLTCVPSLRWTLTWTAAPPPGSPWPPAGVAQARWQAGFGWGCLQAAGPWPASGTPVRSSAFSSPVYKKNK